MIYLIISFFLDILLSNSLASAYQNINYFFPEILICSLPIAYNLIKNKKIFFSLIIFLGIIYDLLYSDIALINLYYFLLYSLFLYIFYNQKKPSLINIIIISLIGTIFYDIYIFFILILIEYSKFKIDFLSCKITHSLLINILYILISVLLLKSRIFGLKKRRKKA